MQPQLNKDAIVKAKSALIDSVSEVPMLMLNTTEQLFDAAAKAGHGMYAVGESYVSKLLQNKSNSGALEVDLISEEAEQLSEYARCVFAIMLKASDDYGKIFEKQCLHLNDSTLQLFNEQYLH